jgi:predicted nucleic acid-binding protein
VFVLDTDILSELRRRRPNPALLRWLDSIGWDQLATTALTIMEIRYGIESVRRTSVTAATAIEEWLTGLLDAGEAQILPLDTAAAQILGRMYATPALRTFFTSSSTARQAKTGADLVIAAIAISQKAIVATNNVVDFRSIHRHFPLSGLFNPLNSEWPVPPAALHA